MAGQTEKVAHAALVGSGETALHGHALASHALGGSGHSADTLANLNAKISDADAVALAGQIGGTAASPDVRGLRESGGQLLAMGAVTDGQYLRRSSTTVVSGSGGAGLDVFFITLTSNYTLTSQTALQKMFNAPAGGQLTVAGSETYFFDCQFNLSSMSTTSGTFSFGFLGTATYTRVKYWALANKGAVTPVAALLTLGNVATATALVAATTTATGSASILGKLVIGTGGTIIPAVGLSVAAAAVVNADAHFKIWKAGTNTVQSYGAWS